MESEAENTAPEMIPVLDRGSVELIDHMGNDLSIVSAARISYDKDASDFTDDRNRKLLRYLIEHGHTSPLEMVEFKFKIKAPIVVWWQFVRHRMAEYNGRSGRYTPYNDDEFYIPDVFRGQDSKNKQKSVTADQIDHKALREKLVTHFANCENLYKEMLAAGVAREQARLALPGFALYNDFIVKMNGHALLNFLKKRDSDAAQYEIRVVAQAMRRFFKQVCPWTHEFCEELGLLEPMAKVQD